MAGGEERELRRRIRTVSATKKITRAMELIAASQIVRAQGRIAGSRPYAEGIGKVLVATASEAAGAKRMVGRPEGAERVLLVAIVSDRGLAGGYNNAVLRTALRRIRAGEEEGRSYQLVTVGRKAISFFRFNQQEVLESFTRMTDRPSFEDARRVAEAVVGRFLAEEADLVEVVSTRFLSPGTQRVETRQLLPLLPEEGDGGGPGVGPGGDRGAGEHRERERGDREHRERERGEREHRDGDEGPRSDVLYEFEPDPEELLQLLVPQYAEAILYQALLEASASEHTARQRAMAAATDNADDLITTYRRRMNRVRQEAITTEIMEIVGGAEALRHADDSTRGQLGLDDRDSPHDRDHEERIA